MKHFKKLTIILLVFLFIFSSPGFVLAVEEFTTSAGQNDAVESPEASTDDQAATGDESESATQEELPTEASKNSDLSALDSESGDLEYGEERRAAGNYLKIDQDSVSGALKFSYGIKIPPGRNGLQPDLELAYNSQSDDNSNIFGYGWSTNIPYIERINRKGIEKLYSENYYYSYLSGELSRNGTSSSYYSAKVDNGEFLTHQLINDQYWLVMDKKGTQYKFGYSTSTRQDNIDDPSEIYKWMLEEIRDTNDNYVRYEYFKDGGQIYPEKIYYTGHDSTDGIFEIEFSRESRDDKATSTSQGFDVITNYRIKEIQSKVTGDWTNKYELYYRAGDNDNRSLLDQIIESGRDEGSNIIALPSDNFNYQAKTKNWGNDSNWSIPYYFTDSDGGDRGARIADVNGDGLPDVLMADSYESHVYINKGDETGWEEDTNWSIPIDFVNAGLCDLGIRIEDVDGDGYNDLVQAYYNTPTSIRNVYINNKNGTGWTQDSSWSVPVDASADCSRDLGVLFADINGDGLTDIIQAYHTGFTAIKNVYINKGDGTGWEQDTNWTIPETFSNQGADQGNRLADVNGDGLVDIVRGQDYDGSTPSDRIVYINQGDGTGWEQDQNYSVPVDFVTSTAHDRGARLIDINGDGLADIVQSSYSYGQGAYINNGDGTGWTQDTNWSIPDYFIYISDEDLGVRFADINGDGLADIIRAQAQYAGYVQEAYIASSSKADLLSEIDTHKGSKAGIIYKGSPEYRDASDNLLNPNSPVTLITAYQIITDDGLSNIATTTYEYSGGDYYFNDSFDRKFAGFQKIKDIDPDGNVKINYFHQGNTSSSSIGEYNDDISKAGKIYRIEIFDDADNLYSKIINKWENYDLGNDADFIKLTQSVDFAYDGDTDHREKAETYSYDDSNGNQISRIAWGEVSGSDDGSFTDSGADRASTTITYTASTTLYIIGLPLRETTEDQSSNKVKETKYYYDNLSIGEVSKGNLTKQEMWKSEASYIDIEKAYNAYGLVTQDKDPRDKATNYVYDFYNLYIATSTDPLGHANQYYYDYSLGKPRIAIDPNGMAFESVYDGLDRIKEEKQPDISNPSSLVTKTAYTYYESTTTPRYVKQRDYLNEEDYTEIFKYLDGFDRVVQERKQSENSDIYIARDYIYNKKGLLYKESLPYFSEDTFKTDATSTLSLYSAYSYDPLERVATMVNAVGTTTNAYDQWAMTVTDAEDNTKELYSDAYGNLVKVDEHNGTSTYTTEYSYDLLGNLARIEDALDNVRNLTYDSLSRLVKSEDLHAPADSDFASTTFAYDASGNLTQKIDGKEQTVNYTYDDINRVLTEDYAGQAGTEASYGYDYCTVGIGRLCSATSTDAVSRYAYNSLGLAATETKKIADADYETSYDYDRLGNLTMITYPDDTEIKYEYNYGGQLEKVSEKLPGAGSYSDLVKNYDYSPLGSIARQVNANNTETTYDYDADELYRLRQKITVATSSPAGTELLDSAWNLSGNNGSDEEYQSIDSDALNGMESVTITYDLNGLCALGGDASAIIFDQDGWQYISLADYGTNCYDGEQSVTISLDDFDDLDPEEPLTGSLHSRFWYGSSFSVDIYSIKASESSTSTPAATTTFQDLNYTYDKVGNIIQIDDRSATDAYKTMAYDYDDLYRLTRASSTNATTTDYLETYSYNAIGNITYKSDIGDYLYAGTGYANPHAVTGLGSGSSSVELLDSAWNLSGNNGSDEEYQSIDSDALNGMESVTITYDLNGLCALGGDASAIIFDQDGWQYVSLADYGTNCYNGEQSVTIPLDDFDDLDPEEPLTGSLHSRFWYGSSFNVDIYSIKANPAGGTGTELSYDSNGNLISDGTWTHAWNHDNRLISSTAGGNTVNYGYDHAGNRVIYAANNSTTTIVNKYYQKTGTVGTKYVYANEQLIATIEGEDINYVHTDHLGGSNLVTDKDGNVTQLLDYYPFGSIRLDEKSGSFDEKRKFTGHEYDEETGLNYMNARYYEGTRGRLLSQDPVFLSVGDNQKLKQKTGLDLHNYLANPQALNAYSYSYNNPLIYRDQSGEFAFLVPLAAYAVAYAPVWVPAAVTTVSAISAVVASCFMGEGIGRMMEGNYLSANQSFDKVQATLGVTAVVAGGLIVADDMMTLPKLSQNDKNTYSRAAEHSQERRHYPDLSKSQIENLARQTRERADIKIEISGKTPKIYYYDSKNNNLFISNPKNPTIFQPKSGLNYVQRAVKNDINEGGWIK